MSCMENSDHAACRSSRLVVNDLCAQIAPLDRYGPADLSSALAQGFRALSTIWKSTFRRAAEC